MGEIFLIFLNSISEFTELIISSIDCIFVLYFWHHPKNSVTIGHEAILHSSKSYVVLH